MRGSCEATRQRGSTADVVNCEKLLGTLYCVRLQSCGGHAMTEDNIPGVTGIAILLATPGIASDGSASE